MMKGCWQIVFRQWKEAKQLLDEIVSSMITVFQQWKGKNETRAGRSCFRDKNGGELTDWNVLGRNEKYAE
jgi:hypothetical protein